MNTAQSIILDTMKPGRDWIIDKTKRITMSQIITETSFETGVPRKEILSPLRRQVHVCRARDLAIVACHRHTKASQPMIGKAFGRHHTSILAAIRRFEAAETERDRRTIETIAARAACDGEAG